MRETGFIEHNKTKWAELEETIKSEKKDPDKLSNLFIQVTDDLSYSRTFYPNRSVRVYLNNIAQQLFYSIYKNKRENKKRFIYFWKEELPFLIYQSRKELLVSLSVFIIAILIGILSSVYDPHFARTILGDSYVEMTLENIKKGDPMGVYKQGPGSFAFLQITFNNVQVAFMSFALGALYAIGTIGFLLYNGIMVGTFQYFFYERGLFLDSFLSIWLHGTLEISSIIIAGGAGLVMGKGLLFPGTYSRVQSFMVSARKGFKILFGIVPIIVTAAVIESFMTRYTEMPDVIKGLIIFLSLFFILAYFVWYPVRKSRRGFGAEKKESRLQPVSDNSIDLKVLKTNGEIFKDISSFYKANFGKLFRIAIILSIAYTLITGFISWKTGWIKLRYMDWFFIRQLFLYHRNPLFIVFNCVMISVNVVAVLYVFQKHIFPKRGQKEKWVTVVVQFLKASVVVACLNSIFYFSALLAFLLILVLVPFFLIWIYTGFNEKISSFSAFIKAFKISNIARGKVAGLFVMSALICIVYFFLLNSPVTLFFYEILSWNISADYELKKHIVVFMLTFSSVLLMNLLIPLLIAGTAVQFHTLKEMDDAAFLREKIASINPKERKETAP